MRNAFCHRCNQIYFLSTMQPGSYHQQHTSHQPPWRITPGDWHWPFLQYQSLLPPTPFTPVVLQVPQRALSPVTAQHHYRRQLPTPLSLWRTCRLLPRLAVRWAHPMASHMSRNTEKENYLKMQGILMQLTQSGLSYRLQYCFANSLLIGC